MNQKQNTPKTEPNATSRQIHTCGYGGETLIFRLHGYADSQILRYSATRIQMAPHTHTNEVTRHFNGRRSGAHAAGCPAGMAVAWGRVGGADNWHNVWPWPCLFGRVMPKIWQMTSGVGVIKRWACQPNGERSGKRTHESARGRSGYNAVDKKVAHWMDV